MAASELAALVDARGTTVRVSLLIPFGVARPVLVATDAGTGEQLYVAQLPDSAGAWQWKVTSVQDQVLVLSVGTELVNSLAPPRAVLLNAAARRVLARQIKLFARGCDCHNEILELLRLYNALALLLFAEGDYAQAQAHLTLLADLEPCACAC